MKDKLIWYAVCFLCAGAAFAGDVAEFKDLGFSEDGKIYFFAQYGVTDRTFQGYAELYAVDVCKNAFVPDGIFRIQHSSATSGKNGTAVYNQLAEKSGWFLKKYNPQPVSMDSVLYLRSYADKQPGAEIKFKDFENSTVDNPVWYYLTLVADTEKSNGTISSSFFIAVEKKDSAGSIISRKTAGNPQYKRAGVLGYRIEKVFFEQKNKNLVIIVEKQIEDKNGASIRYMAETCSAE